MQTTTVSPVTNFITNTTSTTKSQEQILIQSSGAMIAVIVIGIVIIITILLIILKTYNRRTHASRVLGANAGSKTRQKKMSSWTVQSGSIPMGNVGIHSVSGSLAHSNPSSENGFHLPRVDLNSIDTNNIEQNSTASGSTVVTIHGAPLLDNT